MVCFTWEDTQRLLIFTGTLAHDLTRCPVFFGLYDANATTSRSTKLQRKGVALADAF